MNTFNLIDNPWIPVRWNASATGEKPPLVSLNEAFVNSKTIADLDCQPHERIALTRLLVCIAHAALGAPETPDEWDDFGETLDSEAPAYLAQSNIHPHFNLLGEATRFLQAKPKSTDPKDGYPLSKIFFNLSSGNNPKLLDHWGEDPRPWTPEAASLALLCLQNFFVGGSMASKVKGNGPALKSLQMILLGNSLGETIILNCLDLQTLEKTGAGLGKPVWESQADNQLLSRLAPVSCALWLSDDLNRISIDQGHQYLQYEAYRDPFATTQTTKDKTRILRAKPSQGIWRDLHLLTNLKKATEQEAPLTLQSYRDRSKIGESTNLWVGELIKAKDAKIQNCTESTFTIPHDLFTDAGRNIYQAGIEFAETTSKKLWGAIKTHGSTLKNKHPSTDEGQKHFWHTLDQQHRWLIAMAGKPEERKGKKAIGDKEATDVWTRTVTRAALDAYDSVCSRTTPRQIQAYAAGMKSLRKPPAKKKTATKSQQSKLPLKS